MSSWYLCDMIIRCANYVYLCSTKNFLCCIHFAVAQSSQVDDSSHVSVDYFFYTSCIFPSFFISCLHGWFTPKEVHIQSMYFCHLWWITIEFDLQRETYIKNYTPYYESMIWWKHDVFYMFVVAQTTKFYHLHSLSISDFSM